MLDEETSVLSALRREPEQTAMLFKLSAVTAIVLAVWDLVAGSLLPGVAVTAGLVLLVMAYGVAMTFLVARIMTSSRHWVSSSAATASRLATPSSERGTSHGVDIAALRRRPDEALAESAPETPVERVETAEPSGPPPVSETNAFNESYFIMRLQEQVKDARRQGHEMCVAAVHVTIPGMDMTPEIAENVGYEMARIATGQARLMSQPLALSDSEYVFSLPHTGIDETKQFVRDIVRAFGEYWCYFGIAAFPQTGHDAQSLVEKARAACEASLQSGKRSQVEYSAA
jgi:GGDEF domain-containing protein